MNLRPIETMGTDLVLAIVHQALGLENVPCIVLPERMPWPPPNKGKLRLPEIAHPNLLIADPRTSRGRRSSGRSSTS